MAKCDLCKETTPAMELEQLIDGLRVPGVDDVCRGCRKWIEGVRSDELGEALERTRYTIAARAEIPPRWWHWFRKPRPRAHTFNGEGL